MARKPKVTHTRAPAQPGLDVKPVDEIRTASGGEAQSSPPPNPPDDQKPADESRAVETGAEQSETISETLVIGTDLAPGPDQTIEAPEDVKPADQSRAAETGAEQSAPISEPVVIGMDLAPGPDQTIEAPIVALVVLARQPMRRRAGRLFTPEPVRIPVEDLSDDDLAALAGDPMLEVRTEIGDATEPLMHVQV